MQNHFNICRQPQPERTQESVRAHVGTHTHGVTDRAGAVLAIRREDHSRVGILGTGDTAAAAAAASRVRCDGQLIVIELLVTSDRATRQCIISRL